MLRSTQRKMLRKMVGSGRRVVPRPAESCSDDSESTSQSVEEEYGCDDNALEDWVTWASRLHGVAWQGMQRNHLDDWVTMQKRKKWQWAGHTCRRTDGRWSTELLHWTPQGRRKVGHPEKRWSDDIFKFHSNQDGNVEWEITAQDRATWQSLEEGFVNS